MTGLAAWLLALVGPLAVRVIISLAFTAVTLTGVTAVVAQLTTMAQSSWSAIPAAVMQLSSLSGIPQALGTILGAYAARTLVFYAYGMTRYVAKTPS